MKKVFAEIGVGNGTFFSTEFESRSEGDEDTESSRMNVEGESEYRISKFMLPGKINGFYFRFWIFKSVFILSTNGGFEMKKKDKNNLKILFGISGTIST